MKYTIFSHHPRDFNHSVASSIYNVFLKKDAPCPAHNFHKIAGNTNSLELVNLLSAQHTPDMVYVFNGLTNLGFPVFMDILAFLIPVKAKIVIYWHESSWNLRTFRKNKQGNFDKAFALLKSANCYHWATNKKIRELIFYLMGCPSENVSVVYETINPVALTKQKPPGRKLSLIGGGIPDKRKGVGYFVKLSKDVRLLQDNTKAFSWYAARPSKVKPNSTDCDGFGKVAWKGCSKKFHEELTKGDAFILTSVDDPCPIVALEALDAGIPVFCFSTVGTSEILPREFVAENYEELVLRINEYFKNPKSPEVFKNIARNYYPEKFMQRVSFKTSGSSYQYPPYSPSPESKLFESLHFELCDARARLISGGIMPGKISQDLVSRAVLKDIHKEARMEIKKTVRSSEKIKKGTRVIVVGNSPSIKDQEYGHIIDKFDVVIRLNNFQIKGYEKSVGTKTSKIFFSYACKPNPAFKKFPAKNMYLFTADLHKDAERISKRLVCKSPPSCGVPYGKVNKLSPSLYFYGMRLLLNLTDDQWASTGLVATQWAFDIYGKGNVFVHGFSFFEESQHKLQHYFPIETNRDVHHNFNKEKDYMKSMINNGIVRTLPDVSF